jgi:hypothetical protein
MSTMTVEEAKKAAEVKRVQKKTKMRKRTRQSMRRH